MQLVVMHLVMIQLVVALHMMVELFRIHQVAQLLGLVEHRILLVQLIVMSVIVNVLFHLVAGLQLGGEPKLVIKPVAELLIVVRQV